MPLKKKKKETSESSLLPSTQQEITTCEPESGPSLDIGLFMLQNGEK
jgi:hypothetical protein